MRCFLPSRLCALGLEVQGLGLRDQGFVLRIFMHGICCKMIEFEEAVVVEEDKVQLVVHLHELEVL